MHTYIDVVSYVQDTFIGEGKRSERRDIVEGGEGFRVCFEIGIP